MPTSLRSARSAVALVLTLVACDRGTVTDAIVTRDSSGVAIVENDLLRLDASCSLGTTPVVSIGEEEGGEEYVFSGLNGARRLSDGRIVVVDQRVHQVRWYDAEGRYLRSAGRQGEGPGEFTSPYTIFARPGDTVYVGNTRPFQFNVYDPEGTFVRMIRPSPAIGNPPGTFGVLADGRLMLAMNAGSGEAPTSTMALATRRVELHDADGVLTDTIATLPHGRQGVIVAGSNFSTMPLFESYSHSAALDSIVVLGHGAQRELQVWAGAPEMRLVRLIRWSGGDRKVTAADIDADRAHEKRLLDQAPAGAQGFMKVAYETNVHPNRPVADVMPSMNGIRLGTDGRIWIREYYTPADTNPRRWIAFTRDGRYDCTMRTPQFREYSQFDAGHLLVVDADSLGVQRVKLFPVTRPAP